MEYVGRTAARPHGGVLLHVRVLRYNTTGAEYETIGALYRLKRSDASFVVEELWALRGAARRRREVAHIPTAMRESGVLRPVGRLPDAAVVEMDPTH